MTSPAWTSGATARAMAVFSARRAPRRTSNEPSSTTGAATAPPRTRRSTARCSRASRSLRMVTVETPSRDASSLTSTRPVAPSAERITWDRACSSSEGTWPPPLEFPAVTWRTALPLGAKRNGRRNPTSRLRSEAKRVISQEIRAFGSGSCRDLPPSTRRASDPIGGGSEREPVRIGRRRSEVGMIGPEARSPETNWAGNYRYRAAGCTGRRASTSCGRSSPARRACTCSARGTRSTASPTPTT